MNWFWDNILLKREDRVGLLLFCFVLFIFLAIKWYLLVIYDPTEGRASTQYSSNFEYTSLESQQVRKINNTTYSPPPKIKDQKEKETNENFSPSYSEQTKRFEFDPNTLSEDSLLSLGIGRYAASNIVKYRSKGGRFIDPSDLQKIYGLDSLVILDLIPYVQIKKSSKSVKSSYTYASRNFTKKPEVALASIHLNRADTTTLMTLKGIGPVYAKRIVKFRNSLGGFFSIDQIGEVWGISDSLFQAIRPYLSVDPNLFSKKNINEMDKTALVKHPYIDWKKAKILVKYRKMHGPFKSIDEIKKMHGIEPSFADTLAFYFEVQ
ncbi:MAG: helix-hairpin-helix domain-containing protein [Saprospiraceae bacterium]|nr:helix-hairpin-helix domain-containing protein [Saprospiraceae bacterium]